MDSLLAVELRNVLSKRVGERLPATVAFDHPSVQALATMLLQRLAPAVEALPAPSSRPRTGTGPVAIAVIGMACRFPGGGDDPESYWRLLERGAPVAGPVPPERWDHAAIFQPGDPAPGKTNAKGAAFLTDVTTLDASFFGISDPEAMMLDPQQRLVLEVGWEAVESAGLPAERLRDTRTGVYLGVASSEWSHRIPDEQLSSPYALTGTDTSFVPGRLAYSLGLRGPVMSVNTVCSSALVALHHAVRGLQDGDCDAALAGGVNVLLNGGGMVVLAQIGALSPDGVCRSFSADANGYGRGEGCAVVVLKRLADAERDGDEVLGVIRGSAVNHDGRTSGLTAPSGPAQQVVMREALAAGGVRAHDVDYLECHGTGTKLGDPIEVRAAAEVYAVERPAEQPLRLGSAKAVVGHLEAAAAMAGFVKVLLAMRKGVLPPTPVASPNPELPLDEFPLQIVQQATPWPRGARPRMAAISSFGLSGTNAHVVLEEAPLRASPLADRGDGPYVWPVSGRSADQVAANASRLVALDAHPADVGHSLLLHRGALEHRAVLVGADREALAAGLPRLEVRGVRAPGAVFLFGGQGSQRAGMGAELYAGSAAFRGAFDAAVEALRPHLPEDLRQVMWADVGPLDRTEWTQPALFALQVGQAAWWRSLGLEPRVVIGHSIGEFAAGYVAGVWSLEDSARLVAVRGRLMGALPEGGAMIAIGAEEEVVRSALVRGAELAAVNAPGACVISGDEAAVTAVAATLAATGVRTTRLVVSHAFHSHRMEPMLDAWRDAIGDLQPAQPKVRLVPTSDAPAPFGSADYLVAQLRGVVRFGAAVSEVATAARFVELGARPVLGPLVARIVPSGTPLFATGTSTGSELVAAVTAAAGAWASGENVRLDALTPSGRSIPLPPMAWQKKRYWIEPELAPHAPAAGPPSLDGWVHEGRYTAAPVAELPISGTWRIVGKSPLARALAELLPNQGVRLAPDGAPLVVVDETATDGPQAATAAVLDTLAAVRGVGRCAIVTVGAASLDGSAPRLAHRAVLGFSRTLRAERGAGIVIDLDPASDEHQRVANVLTGLGAGDGEMAFRGGMRFTPSITQTTLPEAPPLQGTWWVTGGLGALGLAFARWLVGRGVTDVVLSGRSAPDAATTELLTELRATGAAIHVVAADVAVRADVDRVLAELRERGGVLRGVIHAAGVLDDGLVDTLTPERVTRVLSAKVAGGWNLHEATAGLDLDAFVACSSIVAVAGSPGQTAYGAGNAFLDGLAELRRAAGLPGVSIAWGPWAEVGMAARLGQAHLDAVAAQGLVAVPTANALLALGAALGGPANVVVCGFPHTQRAATARAAAQGAAGGTSLFQVAVRGAPRARWAELVEEKLRGMLAEVGAPVDLSAEQRLWDQGLDSMKLMDLRNQLLKAGVDFPVAKVIAGPPLSELVTAVLETLQEEVPEPAVAPTAGAVAPTAAAAVSAPNATPDGELSPLSPVASHLLAAVAGGGAVAGLGYVVLQLLGLL
jgi:acyl transferase domain-containing protein/aryl carrier-like protein